MNECKSSVCENEIQERFFSVIVEFLIISKEEKSREGGFPNFEVISQKK